MKKKFVEFKCDVCNNSITVEDKQGYPYRQGWCYIYNLNVQIAKVNTHRVVKDMERVEEKDIHTCSKECLVKFLMMKIDFASSYRGTKEELETSPNNGVFHNDAIKQQPLNQQQQEFFNFMEQEIEKQKPQSQQPNFSIDQNSGTPQPQPQPQSQSQSQKYGSVSNPFEKPMDNKPQIVEPEMNPPKKKKFGLF